MIGCLADWPLSGWLLASQSRSGRSSCLSLGCILYKVLLSLQIADEDAEQAPHCSFRGGLAIIVEKPIVLLLLFHGLNWGPEKGAPNNLSQTLSKKAIDKENPGSPA